MGLFSGADLMTREHTTREPVDERSRTVYAPRIPAYIGTYSELEVTGLTAAQSVALRSTIDLIASIGSELPVTVYTGTKKNRREVTTPGSVEDPGGDETGRQDWGYRLLWSWLLTGNAFGDVIERDSTALRSVDLFNPDGMSVNVVDGKSVFSFRGTPIDDPYKFKHWRVNPVPGWVLGLSPIEFHATTIGVSLATSRFGKQWFADGAHPSGLLTNEGDLEDEQADDAKARVLKSRGSSEPLVLGNGWKWQNAQVTPEESQFLQTQGLSEAQCARIYGPGFAEVLGYDGGSNSSKTYANLVDRRTDLLVLGMNRWLSRYERVLSAFTPRPQWVEINRDALLEATTLQRYAAHASSLTNKWRTINEVRRIENLDDVPWGNEPYETSAPPAPSTEGNADGSDS